MFTRTTNDALMRAPLLLGLRSVALVLATFVSCLGGQTPSNASGSGRAEFHLETVEWGRLVDVFDDEGVLVEADVLVRESLRDTLGRYTFSLNPLTQSESLTIHAAAGTFDFAQWFEDAQRGRNAISNKDLTSGGPYSLVARNGAIRIQFSEYLDPESVKRETVGLAVGDPPLALQEVRYLVRQEVGVDGKPKGVLILDPTLSSIDEVTLGIPENGVGFPESFDSFSANVALRIPTVIDPTLGQFEVLRNLAGNRTVGITSSDRTELSANLDPVIVRALRTGNANDPYNGFMLDEKQPKLITRLDASVTSVQVAAIDPNLLTLRYSIDSVNCRPITPKTGDVFEIGSALLVVTRLEDVQDPSNYAVSGSLLTAAGSLAVGDYSLNPLSSALTTSYENADSSYQLCWVRFDPEPEFGLPARGIDPYATATFRFNEPVDVATVKSLETLVLSSFLVNPPAPGSSSSQEEIDAYAARQFSPSAETVGDFIDRQIGYQASGSGSARVKFGSIAAAADSRTFTLAPSSGFADSHEDGDDLRFCFALRAGNDGILDLAGNTLDVSNFVAGNHGQSELVTPGSFSPWPKDRYFALRFNSTDENGDGLSEYIGQYNFSTGQMRGRDLTHFSRVADTSNPYIAQRIAFSQGIMSPLTPAGAVLMTCWPYHLLGFGLLVQSELNVDVEGMSWAPFGGSVFDDIFSEYSIALSHAERTPDDAINTQSGYPKYQNSGLQRNKSFDENVTGWTATDPDFDEEIVSEGFYRISSGNIFDSASGTKMLPWMDFHTTYTWRDNAIPQYASLDVPGYLGGKSGGFLPPEATGQAAVWGPDEHRSIGMPLQARYRCYPKGQEYGANGFQIQIMVGSSALPAFRVFSAGGRDSGGTWHLVVPDEPYAGTNPDGAYNTITGVKTKNHGPELYWQQVDFVVRISRVFTHWFAFGGEPDSITSPVLEPAPEYQAPGTEVVVDFRGSADINVNNCANTWGSTIMDNANILDLYGDMYDFADGGCGTIATPTSWITDVSSLLTHPSGQDFKFFQIRLTFVSNVDQGLEPWLDALGFSWNVQ